MTYRQFHLIFNLPILLLLTLLMWSLGSSTEAIALLAVLVGFVTLVTFPWDNWAVEQGIWDFAQNRVWFRWKHLPIEEVTFFAVQTAIVSLCLMILYKWKWISMQLGTDLDTLMSDPTVGWYFNEQTPPVIPIDHSLPSLIGMGLIVLIWVAAFRPLNRWRKQQPSVTYAWHLLYWILPIIALQWMFGHPILAPRWGSIFTVTVIFGLYYTAADLVAVRQGIWFFDKDKITGHRVFRVLPWEEVAFFFLTSLLVGQSITLLLPEADR